VAFPIAVAGEGLGKRLREARHDRRVERPAQGRGIDPHQRGLRGWGRQLARI
jgi:hypothetical protein